MGNLISQIMVADSPVLVVILSIVLVYLLVKAIYDAGKWIIDRLNQYHGVKNNQQEKDQKIEERISTLQGHDKWQYQKLNQLSVQMKKLINMVQKVQDTQARTIIDTYRNTIFKIYHESVEKGSIKQTELDRFLDLVKRYKEAGGDGIVDEKIYPEILQLPIINE